MFADRLKNQTTLYPEMPITKKIIPTSILVFMRFTLRESCKGFK